MPKRYRFLEIPDIYDVLYQKTLYPSRIFWITREFSSQKSDTCRMLQNMNVFLPFMQ